MFGVLLFRIVSLLVMGLSSIEATDQETQLFNQEPVRVLTSENFINIISQPSLGTFVMYQAPWCGRE